MSDLASLVLTIAPARPLTTPGYLGRAAHALFLQLLEAADPTLTQALHDSDGPKPFTCSTVVGGQRQEKNALLFVPEKPAWLRFTGLTTAVSDHLRRLAAAPPAAIELDGLPFRLLSATLDSDEHPWAGQSSYEALGAPYLLAQQPPNFRLGLTFASPTTFRSQGRSQPVPMPTWVFGSLVDRWNAFATVRLSPETRRFAEECVVLSRYRLHTRAVPYKDIIQMGCQGHAHYVCLNRDKYWASMLNLLADYAFYSGVGYQTSMGLGQAQRLET